MKSTKHWMAAGAVAALLAGTAACSSGGDARATATARPTGATEGATATACASGTYVWFNVAQRDVLTGIAEKQVLGKGGGKLTEPIRRLHTPRVAVDTETGPKVDAAAALRSLGRHIGGAGGDAAFSEVGRPAPDVDGNVTHVDGPGTFVEYTYVREVVADFRLTCPGGEPSTGRALSHLVDGTGILDCAEPPKALEDGTVAQAAARLSCGATKV
ncbi:MULTISPECIES: hypothetical protein [Streptomyces]|uniref:Lipoprotein n=2 Tax=Streptomyces TaxID=1883 RepID=A0ABU4K0X8_9ACTN|nr:hypothetical protein [Streptomyces roseolus]MDX2291184.1 hypothetical protein [Streptomyces roseolus]